MRNEKNRRVRQLMAVALGLALGAPSMLSAQGPGTENGQWAYLGGDAWHTRYTTANEITRDNFGEMQMLWRFNAGSFGPSTPRATPSYVDGKMFTVTGDRRPRRRDQPGQR
jgi:quinoprotein glucose dehydrogenase